jgi:hypothetical protein
VREAARERGREAGGMRLLAGLVAVRRSLLAPGFGIAVDPSRLVHTATEGMDFVAGTGHLRRRAHRRTRSCRARRLAPPRKPLWMAVAGTELGPSSSVVRAGLRCLLPGGAGIVARPPDGRSCGDGRGVGRGVHHAAFALAAVPHGPAAVAPVAVCGVGRRGVRSNGDPSLPVSTSRRRCRAGGNPLGVGGPLAKRSPYFRLART